MFNSGVRLVWIDLEFSGLDLEKEVILEIATIITDKNLDIVAEGPDIVLHADESIILSMDEWNTIHHNASGLIEKVRKSSYDHAKAEEEVLAFIKDHCPPKSILCGNSIHQDRKFLAKYMSTIDSYLHYRMLDVTTVKILTNLWKPNLRHPIKKTEHRALSDIIESIEELRFYKEHFLWL